MMIKSLVILILCLTVAVTGNAQKDKYKPLPLHYMILDAGLVFTGEIIKVDTGTFRLKILQKIAGNFTDSIINVKQYADWKCSARWAKYAAGQNVMLFVKKNSAGEWNILSDGGEGEMPVKDDIVYLPATYSIGMPFYYIEEKGLTGENRIMHFEVLELYGAEYRGAGFKLSEVADAITGTRNCFTIKTDKTTHKNEIKPLCKQETITSYKIKSKLLDWLIGECMKKS